MGMRVAPGPIAPASWVGSIDSASMMHGNGDDILLHYTVNTLCPRMGLGAPRGNHGMVERA